MHNVSYNDFIGIYDNVLSKENCRAIIDYFEYIKKFNLVKNYDQYSLSPAHEFRKDETVFILEPEAIHIDKAQPLVREFASTFWKCYEDYTKEFSILRSVAEHGFFMLRLQKTNPGGGFHSWHFENIDQVTSSRVITFMLYLNTIEDGGETEFLYLHKREKPVEGRLIIWPSSFTHTHRGNPPLVNSKYILTGWLNYFG
jgi:hypothetical protein